MLLLSEIQKDLLHSKDSTRRIENIPVVEISLHGEDKGFSGDQTFLTLPRITPGKPF